MVTPFLPSDVYSSSPPYRVMVAPPRYVQGPGAIDVIGRVAAMSGFNKLAVLASQRGHQAQAADVCRAVAGAGGQTVSATFGGECSVEEITARADEIRPAAVDCLIAVGGGKCVDAGKCIAYRLQVPVIIVPTLASNDAPCSALSVVYSPQGVVTGVEFFPANPIAVIVDTAVVADASERYLVAGMGDAMATWYEARVCARNPEARTLLGARPTLAAEALGEICAKTLFAQGEAAACNVREHQVTETLEQVVEANTLLSGLGFESGGLAGAHAYAQGYTVIPEVEQTRLHGEMVAMGTVAQLVMEQDPAEAERVARFFVAVGLPIQLAQMGLAKDDHERLDAIVGGAMSFAPLANFPFAVTADKVKEAMLQADELGARVTRETGEEAYLRCMSNA